MPKKIKQLVICALIAAIFCYLTAFAGMAEASINIFGGGMITSDFTVSDDFSSDFYIDQPLSRYNLQDEKLYAENGSISSRIVSQAIAYSSYNIGSAKLVVSDYTPAGGRIVYFLSNDNGQTWTQAQLNVFVNFNSTGKTLRWSAAISRQSPDAQSPFINSLTITYKYGYDTGLYAAYDNQRINDLSAVANALNDFYGDYGVYPHVSGATTATSWNELMTLLSRNRRGNNYPYLYAPVNDPLHDSDENITYGYEDLSSNEYVLTASFQSEADYAATGGFRGSYGNVTCNYPTYCVGTVRGAFSGGNTGQVLGAYTTGSTTVSVTRTNSSYPSHGLLLYSMIAKPLNDLIGRPVFKLGDYYETVSSTETTANVSAPKSGIVAGVSISKAAGVATGTAGSLILSLLLSGMITFLYMGYTRTGLFKKRDAWAAIRNNLADKNRFNFANR